MSSPLKEVLTEEEVASMMLCEPMTVQNGARNGEIPAVKMGRSWVYPRAALMEFLNQEATKNINRPPRQIPIPTAVVVPHRKGGKQRRILPNLDQAA